MKKILLIIAITLVIFQMVVLATAITIGNEAIDRSVSSNGDYTQIDRNNPADGNGIITSIELYAELEMTGVEVATLYCPNPGEFPNKLTSRDDISIGTVSVGYHQYDVSLEVNIGDYIGIHFTTGGISRDNITSTGYHSQAGDNIPCINHDFGPIFANRIISLYGTGTTEVGWPHKWNTQTISKWNTKEFTKWNGLE